MESFLALIFISVLLFIQIKMFKNLCAYLSEKYPEEWKKIENNRMGGSAWSATTANFNESLKSGFFATISDTKIDQFTKFKSFNLALMGLAIFAQLLLAFLQ
jgi:hypothetical protein